MALSKSDVLYHLIANNGWNTEPNGVEMYRKAAYLYDNVLKRHLLTFNWDFMVDDAEEYTSLGSAYTVDISSSDILVITSVYNSSAGITSPPYIRPISMSFFDALRHVGGGDGTKAVEYVSYARDELYLFPEPESGTKITIRGIVDPDSNTSIEVPEKHTMALVELMNYYLSADNEAKKASLARYMDEARALGSAEILRDIWGNYYGIDEIRNNPKLS